MGTGKECKAVSKGRLIVTIGVTTLQTERKTV